MADNRWWLADKEAGLCIMLGKTFGPGGMYEAPNDLKLELFYEMCFAKTGNSDPDLSVLEDNDNSWTYSMPLTDAANIRSIL